MNGSGESLLGLRDVRAPDGAYWASDALAGLSVGLMVAILMFVLVNVCRRRSLTPGEIAMAALRESRRLAPSERLLSLAALAADALGERERVPRSGRRDLRRAEALEKVRAEIRAALYIPDAPVDLDDLDRRVGLLIAQGGR